MSAGTHGAASGLILGIVLVLLAQQFGLLDLSYLVPSIEDLIVGGLVGGVAGGLLGWALGRKYLREFPAR
ncbi:MAG: hypothetical protein ACYDFT_06105 [Thermoplasmata archaeon]